MTLYSVTLFLHIVGALGLFAALGLEWTSLRQLRRATTAEQAHEWLNALGLVRRMGPASLTAIFLSGLYLVATAWGIVAWIAVALGAMLLLPPLGAFNGLRLAAIGRRWPRSRARSRPTSASGCVTRSCGPPSRPGRRSSWASSS